MAKLLSCVQTYKRYGDEMTYAIWLEFAFIADANGVAALMLDGVFDCVALGCRLARGGSAASCKLVGESGADWLNGLGAWITGDANEASIARVQAGWPFPIPILGRVQ